MADEIAGVGIRVDTDDVSKGIKALDALADQGPKVEKSLAGVEATVSKTGKSLATLGQGQGAGEGLAKVAQSSQQATTSIGALGDAATKAGAASTRAGAEAAAGLDKIGISAKQTAAALRGVPAQFTDIVTALQGGQAPLTVLLQQGGQLKDMFGGVGAAARALGGYVVGLINPFTLAAAAAGSLAYAYKLGSDEAKDFNATLIVTGNRAGLTATSLMASAAALRSMGTSQGKAAEVLNALAESGRVGAQSFEKLTIAAINYEKVGGPAVEKTVEAFAKLGESPTQAALKLNEATNFLTASVLKQIQALEEQGKTTQAAQVAQEAYAASINARVPQLAAQLGLLEKAWLGIKSAASGAADIAKDIGRPDTIAQLEIQRQAALSQAARLNGGGLLDNFAQGRALGRAADLQAQIESLKEQDRLLGSLSQKDAERARITASMGRWLDDENKYLDKTEQLTREIARIEADGQRLIQQGLLTEKGLRDRIAAVRAKFTDQGGVNEVSALRARLVETNRYIEALSQQGGVTRELNEGEKKAAELREQLNGSLTATARAQKEEALALANTLGLRLQLSDALKRDVDDYAKLTAAVGSQADAIKQRAIDQEAANAVFGQGRTAIEALTLAELKNQAIAAESASFDEKYRANLDAKIAAQERYVKSLAAADFKTMNQGAQEWLRAATEAAQLQAAEPAMLALSAAERERITANRAVDLKLAKELDQVEKSSLTTTEKAAVASQLRAAADQDRARNATAASQQALREINDYLDPGRAESFGAGLAKGFDTAGNSLVRMSSSLNEFSRQQRDLAKQQANLAQIQSPVERQAAALKLNERSQQNQIALYAGMAGAAKGFFAEGSKGYKALEAAETAFRVVQLASDLQKGLSAAAVGIATQAQGDPYTAIPRMAAMAGIMAALGFSVGGIGGGGSSGGGDGRAQATGTGTVLGDAAAKSESIAKSIDLLSDTAKLQLTTQSGMLSALRNIENSLGGLSGLIVRTNSGDITTGASFGVKTGLTGSNAFLGTAGMSSIADFVGDSFTNRINNALFGNKTSITGTGLNLPQQSLAQAINNSQLQQYVDTYSSKKFFGITYSSSTGSQYQAADAQLANQFTSIFKSFYDGVKLAAGPLGQSLDEVEARLNGFVLNIGKIDLKGLTGEQIQEKLTAVLGAAADNIATAAIPGLQAFQKVGEGYFETLVRVASGVETATADLESLGIAAIAFGDVARKQGDVAAEIVRQSIAAFEAADGSLSSIGQLINNLDAGADDIASTYKALVDVRDILLAAGESGDSLTASMIRGAAGLDNLQNSLSTYLGGKFFSDQERASAALQSLQAQFARIGISTVPTSYAAFRALVEGIDTSTDAGQKLYGQVLGLASAFQTAQEAAEKAGAATTAAASRLPDILKSQAGERDGLLVDLLKAQGDAAGAAALKRQHDLAKLTEGLTAAETAAAVAGYDYIASLRGQVEAANAASQAAQAESQRLAAVATQRSGLETTLLQLQGDTAALRERELAALDPTNRALQQHIYALQDEQAAAQAAADHLAAVANERAGLENTLLQMTGNTAEIRRRELEALDPTNRALQERIYALQDEQEAQAAAAQAAEEAQRAAEASAQAAEELRRTWQGITDSLLEEVKRIRGLSGNSPQSLAQAKAQFAITTGQARAGDQDAAKLLPSLSQAMLALAQSQASSFTELSLLRARTAASLAATAALLQQQFGLNLPKLATGTNSVPEDMAVIVHKGEAIVPRAYNPALGGGGGGQLLAAINGLREDQRVQSAALVRLQNDQNKLQRKWDQQGLPAERIEA